MTDQMSCPLLTDVLLGQLDDALGRIAGDLDILAFDVVSVGVPNVETMSILPVATVLVTGRGYDLTGPHKTITAWNNLEGFWCEQSHVDEVTRTVLAQIRKSRARQEHEAKMAANGLTTP